MKLSQFHSSLVSNKNYIFKTLWQRGNHTALKKKLLLFENGLDLLEQFAVSQRVCD